MEENLIITRVSYDVYTRKVLDLPRLGHRPPVVYRGNFDELARDTRGALKGLEILAAETTDDSFIDADETDWIWVKKFSPKLRRIRRNREKGREGGKLFLSFSIPRSP